MHPDKKVGLALGILLIGFVAAFFFRNEAPDPDREAPTLANPTGIDDRIRHQRHTPYLPDNERRAQDLAKVPDGLVPEVAPQIPGRSNKLSNNPVPEPILTHSQRESITPVPVPGGDIAGLDSILTKSGTGDRTGKRDETSKSGLASSGSGVHEVVAGETLSSISLKYLGTNRRFLDVYEANKDVLRGPNDLVVGMKLKIPTRDGQPQAANSPSATAVSETGALSSPTSGSTATPSKLDESTTPKASFVRPKNGPVRPPTRPGKSLTQTPPPGVPSVDGLDLLRDPQVVASRPGADDGLGSDTTAHSKTSAR